MAFKKLNQRFIHTDSTVNVYGFKLLTSGYLMDEFLKNPIGYYGHDKTDGILLRWEDMRLDGDQVSGVPVVNMEHPRAERTVTEIEEGFLNAASVGHICLLDYILEDTGDPENPMVVGTRWYNKETSVVDSPGNRGAFKVGLSDDTFRVFDSNDVEINLSDIKNLIIKKTTTDMKEIQLKITPSLISILSLSDDADGKEVAGKIKDLADRAKAGDAAVAQAKLLTTEKDKAVKDLADFKAEQEILEMDAVLAKGLADGKYDVVTQGKLKKQFAGNLPGLKDVVETMKSYEPITGKLKDGELPKDLADKTYTELHKSGKLKLVQEKYPEHYGKLYEERFGKKPGAKK